MLDFKGSKAENGFVVVKIHTHNKRGYQLIETKTVVQCEENYVLVRSNELGWLYVPITEYFNDFYDAVEHMQLCAQEE